MIPWTDAIPYFPRHELADSHTGVIVLDPRFAALLPALRTEWGSPLLPTSVCREPATNSAVGGHPRSLHLTENPRHATAGCMAADLFWEDWPLPRQEVFYQKARRLRWACGLHPTFIHIDLRRFLGLWPVTFHYDSWDDRFPDVPDG